MTRQRRRRRSCTTYQSAEHLACTTALRGSGHTQSCVAFGLQAAWAKLHGRHRSKMSRGPQSRNPGSKRKERKGSHGES